MGAAASGDDERVDWRKQSFADRGRGRRAGESGFFRCGAAFLTTSVAAAGAADVKGFLGPVDDSSPFIYRQLSACCNGIDETGVAPRGAIAEERKIPP